MAGVEHRRPGSRQAGNGFEQEAARLRIDADGRFVEEQQFRLAEQADGQVEAPAQAAGQLLGAFAGDLFEAGEGDGLVDSRPPFGTCQIEDAAEKLQVFGHGEHRVEGVILWHQGDGARFGGPGFGQWPAVRA